MPQKEKRGGPTHHIFSPPNVCYNHIIGRSFMWSPSVPFVDPNGTLGTHQWILRGFDKTVLSLGSVHLNARGKLAPWHESCCLAWTLRLARNGTAGSADKTLMHSLLAREPCTDCGGGITSVQNHSFPRNSRPRGPRHCLHAYAFSDRGIFSTFWYAYVVPLWCKWGAEVRRITVVLWPFPCGSPSRHVGSAPQSTRANPYSPCEGTAFGPEMRRKVQFHPLNDHASVD